jgi:hypothetical protein
MWTRMLKRNDFLKDFHESQEMVEVRRSESFVRKLISILNSLANFKNRLGAIHKGRPAKIGIFNFQAVRTSL